MKFMKLHSKTTTIVYKNSLCSLASFFVFFSTMTSIIIPILLVSFLSPYSGISEVRVLYEQPCVKYQHKFILLGGNNEDNGSSVACSTFPYFNKITEEFQKCSRIKFWQEDFNYDGIIDQVNFEFNVDTSFSETAIKDLYLTLFFEAFLKHKCSLKPPAVLIQEITIPSHIFPDGKITLRGHLELTQNYEFLCPYYGRRTKSHFQNTILSQNTSKANLFDIKSIRQTIKANPAYFELKTTETYFEKLSPTEKGLKILLIMDIVEVNARYHLSIWERLGQFWLYFASFFGISFYICNKVKDILFGRHILTSWEIIPWKKLY